VLLTAFMALLPLHNPSLNRTVFMILEPINQNLIVELQVFINGVVRSLLTLPLEDPNFELIFTSSFYREKLFATSALVS
jgi:hypothetical protein